MNDIRNDIETPRTRNVAIVGATGVVGRELIALIEERNFPFSKIRLLASENSTGREIKVRDRAYPVESLADADPTGIDLAFFCAGAERSRRYAPAFAEKGARVIDNSSAFRRDPQIPLVVPEINGHLLDGYQGRLIANPNCSTIAALLPLAALHRAFGLERVLVSTYQAVSGAGAAALEELENQTRSCAAGEPVVSRVLPKRIVYNLIPWIGEKDESGFCEEEQKIAFESRKILSLPALKISATTVRVPVRRCHSLSIWVRLSQAPDRESILAAFSAASGVVVTEAPPCPGDYEGTDPVYVSRLRRDPDEKKAFWFWAVSDQLRKGAALNAIQIAERIYETRK
ncbi:MAG: aspartate-semialdehyde dehydrogenase [Planctomycetes bacterium]|nr:aspartate-semialdehyde dehydrogenase [Planctomycetota bacterium]